MVIHIGGGIGFAADGDRVGIALDHLGIGDDDNDRNDNERNGDRNVKDAAAALHGLFFLRALCLGINIAVCQLLLTGLLLSGCTHLFVQSSQLVG